MAFPEKNTQGPEGFPDSKRVHARTHTRTCTSLHTHTNTQAHNTHTLGVPILSNRQPGDLASQAPSCLQTDRRRHRRGQTTATPHPPTDTPMNTNGDEMMKQRISQNWLVQPNVLLQGRARIKSSAASPKSSWRIALVMPYKHTKFLAQTHQGAGLVGKRNPKIQTLRIETLTPAGVAGAASRDSRFQETADEALTAQCARLQRQRGAVGRRHGARRISTSVSLSVPIRCLVNSSLASFEWPMSSKNSSAS